MAKNYKGISDEFLSSLISGNRKDCSKIAIEKLLSDPSVINLYEELLKPALYSVGKLWENNKISVATEHLATFISEAILNESYDQVISDIRIGKKVVVACVEKEYHQVGIKMVANVFENNGWDALFLGANVPVTELIIFIKSENPDMLALSLSIYFHLPTLKDMLKLIRLEFPELPVIVGGQAFMHGGREVAEKFVNVKFIGDLHELDYFIKKNQTHG